MKKNRMNETERFYQLAYSFEENIAVTPNELDELILDTFKEVSLDIKNKDVANFYGRANFGKDKYFFGTFADVDEETVATFLEVFPPSPDLIKKILLIPLTNIEWVFTIRK